MKVTIDHDDGTVTEYEGFSTKRFDGQTTRTAIHMAMTAEELMINLENNPTPEAERIPVMPLLMDAHIEYLGEKIYKDCGLVITHGQLVRLYNSIRDWTAM